MLVVFVSSVLLMVITDLLLCVLCVLRGAVRFPSARILEIFGGLRDTPGGLRDTPGELPGNFRGVREISGGGVFCRTDFGVVKALRKEL